MIHDELKQLNKNQLKAIHHEGGPVYVIAGAGTGKTKTLTMRIAFLIDHGVDPDRILALTFTNKAAREIRERVNKAVFPKSIGSWLYTFHALGNKILKTHAKELGLNYTNGFSIIDEKESKDIIEESMKELNLYNDTIKIGDVVEYIYERKMKNIEKQDDDIENIYKRYVKNCIKNQLMDFTDLITYMKVLFTKRKDILEYYQDKFEHILVDEFQDTDKIQYEIIKMLNKKHNNIFVVGDPDQSIYSFRGARYLNNELFIKELKAKTITLDKNYRSTKNILKTANKLIKFNETRTTKKDLHSDKEDGIRTEIITYQDEIEEAAEIANSIRSKIRDGIKPKEIAVLYRNNTLSRNLEHWLIRENIPYTIYGGLSFYQRKEIKDILAYVKVALDTNNDFFIKRIINTPKRGIGKKAFQTLKEHAEKNNISIFKAIDRVKLGLTQDEALRSFKRLINNIGYKIETTKNLEEIVDYVFEKSEYQKELNRDESGTREERYENIQELKTAFRNTDEFGLKDNNIDKVTALLDEITLFTEKESKKDKKSVILSTVHQVKGLEFEVVYVMGLEEDLFPNYRAKEDNERLEEERRLFYVAVTRAKKKLIINNTERRTIYGIFRFNRPSIFIKEIMED